MQKALQGEAAVGFNPRSSGGTGRYRDGKLTTRQSLATNRCQSVCVCARARVALKGKDSAKLLHTDLRVLKGNRG